LACDLLSEGIPEGGVRAEYCQMPCHVRVDLTACISGSAQRRLLNAVVRPPHLAQFSQFILTHP